MLLRIESWSAVLAFFVIILLTTANFLMRNFIKQAWSIEMADLFGSAIPHMILLLGFLGASIGISRNETIRIDFLRRYYTKIIQKWIQPVLFLATFALSGIYIYTAFLTSEIDESPWIVWAYIPVLFLLTLKSLLHVFLNGSSYESKSS